MSDPRNPPFVDLPADCYPLRIEYYSISTSKIVRIQEVPSPGMVRIPGHESLGLEAGDVGVRISYADGMVCDTDD